MRITPLSEMDHAVHELDGALLRSAFGCFPSGVVGVCALSGDAGSAPIGMAASSFVAVSLAPALVAFCVQWTSSTWPLLEKRPRLGISVLSDGHGSVARQLASRSRDRFEGLELQVTSEGAVFVEGATAWLDCTVDQVVPAGDHGIVVLRVNGLSMIPMVEPLVFHGSSFRTLHPLQTA